MSNLTVREYPPRNVEEHPSVLSTAAAHRFDRLTFSQILARTPEERHEADIEACDDHMFWARVLRRPLQCVCGRHLQVSQDHQDNPNP